jgi:O-antigen ligase
MIVSAYLSLTLFLLSADLLYVDVAGNKIKFGYFLLLGLWCFNPGQMWTTVMDAVRRVPKYVLLPLVPLAIAVATSGNYQKSTWWMLWLAFDLFTIATVYAFLRVHRLSIDQVQEAVAHSLALIALFGVIQFAFIYGFGHLLFDPQVHLDVYRLNGLAKWPHFLNIFSFLLLPMVVTQRALSMSTKVILILLIFVLAQSTAKTGWVLFVALGALLLVFERRFLRGKYLLLLIPAVAIALFVPFHSTEGQRPVLSGAQKIARFGHDFTNTWSVRDRVLINEMGVKVWLKHPWFGVGPKAYQTYVFDRFDQELAGENKYDIENKLNARNENIWIEFLVECGALFTLAFLAVLIRALWVPGWSFANPLHLGAWIALVLYFAISGQVSQTGLLTMVYAVFGLYFYAREMPESAALRTVAPASTAPEVRAAKK